MWTRAHPRTKMTKYCHIKTVDFIPIYNYMIYNIALQYSILKQEIEQSFGIQPLILIYLYLAYRFIMLTKLWLLFITKYTISSSNNKTLIMKILNQLSYDSQHSRSVIGIGEIITYNNINISEYMLDLKSMYIYNIYQRHEMNSLITLNMEVYWFSISKKTFHHVNKISNKSIITLYESEEVEEIAYSDDVDKNIIENSKQIANVICDKMYKERRSQIFMLSGPPGCGKTTTARIIAKQLNATLYPDYTPIRPEYNLWSSYNYVKYNSQALVVVMEEVDVVIKAIKNGKITSTKCNIMDKISWNNTLDKIKRMNNIVLIMTTNKSLNEIKDMCNDDSLTRKHRIDGFCVFENDGISFTDRIT